jgi:Trk K+ transport system NAD-binding subunit
MFLDRMLSDKKINLCIEEVTLNNKFEGKTIGELTINRFENTSLLDVLDGDNRPDSPNSGKNDQKTL